jgi:N-acetylglucosaminyl-diphospho-decaprenol L-rhamnosyltransferase
VIEAHHHFSAVVVSFHTGEVLYQCLNALLAAPLCRQIVLVNNGNPDIVLRGLQELAGTHHKLILIEGHGNIGFGQGCNLGAQHALCDNLVFVNPDCIVDESTLAAFGTALAADPKALLGGALRNEDGSEQRGCRRGELTLWSAFVSFLGFGKPGPQAGIWRDFNRNREPFPEMAIAMPTVSGALMAISKDAFARVGGFDVGYFLHVEDVDLCARMRTTGGDVLFLPAATALHIGATSHASNWAVNRAKIKSFARFFWKRSRGIRGRLAVIVVMPFLAVAILLRSLVR